VAALSTAGVARASVAQTGEDVALRASLGGHGGDLGGTVDGGILWGHIRIGLMKCQV
jgi:hypothetical protein